MSGSFNQVASRCTLRPLTCNRFFVLVGLLAAVHTAYAGNGNGYIETRGASYSEGITITIDGTDHGPIHFYRQNEEQQTRDICNWLKYIGKLDCEIDPGNSRKVIIKNIRAIGIRSDNGTGNRSYGLDPPPPVRGNLSFPGGKATGLTSTGVPSTLEFALNGVPYATGPFPSEPVDGLLARMAADLSSLGYDVSQSPSGLRLYLRHMPGGVEIVDLTWWTDDVGLLKLGAVLTFNGIGDMNCDDVRNFADVNPFVLAVSDPAGYELAFPDCDVTNADVNGDDAVNFADINPFVALLTAAG